MPLYSYDKPPPVRVGITRVGKSHYTLSRHNVELGDVVLSSEGVWLYGQRNRQATSWRTAVLGLLRSQTNIALGRVQRYGLGTVARLRVGGIWYLCVRTSAESFVIPDCHKYGEEKHRRLIRVKRVWEDVISVENTYDTDGRNCTSLSSFMDHVRSERKRKKVENE